MELALGQEEAPGVGWPVAEAEAEAEAEAGRLVVSHVAQIAGILEAGIPEVGILEAGIVVART